MNAYDFVMKRYEQFKANQFEPLPARSRIRRDGEDQGW
jgi:hypothetical protein